MSGVVLAISGSQRKKSFTEKMLDLLIEGMGEGLEVHKFYPHKMNIGPCNSCWSCWGKKRPGECAQKDDFEQILEVFKRADYFLIAAPLYIFDFPATVKNVLDRFFINLESAQVEGPDGLTKHPNRFENTPKTVLVSSCGFPDVENFDILRKHFKAICPHLGWKFSGEVLIPGAGGASVPKLFDEKYELIRKTGAELVAGSISEETTDAILAPVVSAEDYRRMATLSFEGGVIANAKMMSIAMKAIRASKKK